MSQPEDRRVRAAGAGGRGGSASEQMGAGTTRFVEELASGFRTQVERALATPLAEGDVGLAYIDHYLRLGRDEDREPILWLLAAGAGAYFGELIRREIGANWVGDGEDPRRLRLLLTPQLVHFAPVDMAFAAILGASEKAELEQYGLDTAFNFPEIPADPPDENDLDEDDAETGTLRVPDSEWIRTRLSEMPPMSEDEFVSLTGRFETLRLVLGLLAERHASEGRQPRTYALADYLGVLAGDSA
jgi:hypothetical protein